MPALVFYILVFATVGVFFLFFHLLMGSVIRPSKPESEKLTIYECGEPTVGSAWVQFDLRYYVVALLFVIFDVEVAFFFPWAVVFGSANQLSHVAQTDAEKAEHARIVAQLTPANLPPLPGQEALTTISPEAAHNWALVGFSDIMLFFGVLMVGYAYLWKRGDIAWVRGKTAPEPSASVEKAVPPVRPAAPALAASAH